MENLVGWFRRNFLVPMKKLESWEKLNEAFIDHCRSYAGHHIKRHLKSVGDEFIEDKEHLLILPGKPLDTSETQQVKVHSDSLVRFDNSFYSVPARFVGEPVTAKAFTIEVFSAGECLSSHKRSFTAGEVSYLKS